MWQTSEGQYLIEGARTPLSFGAEQCVKDPSGSHVQPAVFHLVSRGALVERFSEPIAYSIEDELGVTNIHAVYNDKLYCYHFKEVYGRECGFTTNLVLAGLQWIDTEEVLTYIWSAVRIHETEREGWFEQRARELSEQRTLEQAAFDRFMASLKTLSHPVQAIWAYGDTHSEWVIRAEDGHELARGPGVDHGLRSYQRAHALVKEFGPPGSSLDTRLSPAEEMSFYPD